MCASWVLPSVTSLTERSVCPSILSQFYNECFHKYLKKKQMYENENHAHSEWNSLRSVQLYSRSYKNSEFNDVLLACQTKFSKFPALA